MRPKVFASLSALALLAAPVLALKGETNESKADGLAFATPSSGALRAEALGRRELPGADLESKARAFAEANRDRLALGAESALELRGVRHGKAVDVVRFRQTAFGLPVLRTDLAVSFDKSGRAIFAASDLRPLHGDLAALVRHDAPFLSSSAARSVALARVRVEGSLTFDETSLAIFAADDRARLVWSSRFVPTGAPTGDWEVLVDAATGEVVRVEDRSAYGEDIGQGQAFMPDPLSSSGSAYGAPYNDNGDANNSSLIAEIFEVQLREMSFDGTFYSLAGPYADCRGTLESPAVACRTLGSLDWRLDSDGGTPGIQPDRSSDLFEEMNVYYHLDTFLRYINEDLAIEVLPIQYVGGVRFDPHGLSGDDNSHYISSTGILAFGDGCVDDSEDADVVIHELGHGIHDWVTNGSLSQVNGLSEGVGDYFAVSYSRNFFLNQWDSADPQFNWVFSWDGHNECWSGRVTTWNDNHLYNTSLPFSHTNGQFWSSCNLDIAEVLGYDVVDAAMLEGLSMTSSSTNQAQAAQAVMTAAEALGYSFADRQFMALTYNDNSGGFGCNYAVAVPTESILDADFEENDFLEWSSHVP